MFLSVRAAGNVCGSHRGSRTGEAGGSRGERWQGGRSQGQRSHTGREEKADEHTGQARAGNSSSEQPSEKGPQNQDSGMEVASWRKPGLRAEAGRATQSCQEARERLSRTAALSGEPSRQPSTLAGGTHPESLKQQRDPRRCSLPGCRLDTALRAMGRHTAAVTRAWTLRASSPLTSCSS